MRKPLGPVILFCLLVPALLAAALAWLQAGQQRDFVASQSSRQLQQLAILAAAYDVTPESIPKLAEQTGARVWLLDVAEGLVVVAESGGNSVGGNSVETVEPGDDDIFNARRTGVGHARRIVAGIDRTFVTVPLPRTEAGSVRLLRFSLPTFGGDDVSGRNLPIALWRSGSFWLFVMLALAGGLLTSLLTAAWLRRPLQRMRRALLNLREIQPGADFRASMHEAPHELSEAVFEAAAVLQEEFQREQRRTRDLEGSSRFLETVLRSMIEGVLAFDGAHRIVFANDAAGPLLDASLTGEALKGRQLLEVIRHQTLDQTLSRVLDGQDRIRAEFKLPRSDRSISVFGTRLTGDTESGAVLVLHDVTELRRLENMRREFVSNVSHELKTPLAAIQAYAETLAEGALNDPSAGPLFVNRIIEQAENLHELILDILQLSRIETGKETFEIRDVSVAETILESVDEHQPLAGAKGINIALESETTDLFVRADARGLRTIIDNLLSNAVKYTPGNGSIRVRWGVAGGQVSIEVIDSGIGIPPEHAIRIFERFYRVDEARSRDVGGTGLGLSIVKHLTQVFGGQVGVQSEPDRGSTFTVLLPASGALSGGFLKGGIVLGRNRN